MGQLHPRFFFFFFSLSLAGFIHILCQKFLFSFLPCWISHCWLQFRKMLIILYKTKPSHLHRSFSSTIWIPSFSLTFAGTSDSSANKYGRSLLLHRDPPQWQDKQMTMSKLGLWKRINPYFRGVLPGRKFRQNSAWEKRDQKDLYSFFVFLEDFNRWVIEGKTLSFDGCDLFLVVPQSSRKILTSVKGSHNTDAVNETSHQRKRLHEFAWWKED